MHSLLHDIPRFLILSLEELFLIFNQMLSIRAFSRRAPAILIRRESCTLITVSWLNIVSYVSVKSITCTKWQILSNWVDWLGGMI